MEQDRVFFISILEYFFMSIPGFPGGSVGKESACNAGDSNLIPGSGRYSGKGKGYPLQYSSILYYGNEIKPVNPKGNQSWVYGKEIKPVNPKGNQSWVFIGRMQKLKLQYFGYLMWRTDSFEKTLMLEKIEGGRRRGQEEDEEDEKVGWHHWFDEHEFEQAPEVSDGEGSMACCSPGGHKESDITE